MKNSSFLDKEKKEVIENLMKQYNGSLTKGEKSYKTIDLTS
jgi:hypothetical protein